jgi:hypothetical protein
MTPVESVCKSNGPLRVNGFACPSRGCVRLIEDANLSIRANACVVLVGVVQLDDVHHHIHMPVSNAVRRSEGKNRTKAAPTLTDRMV